MQHLEFDEYILAKATERDIFIVLCPYSGPNILDFRANTCSNGTYFRNAFAGSDPMAQ